MDLDDLLSRQHGLVARRQLLELERDRFQHGNGRCVTRCDVGAVDVLRDGKRWTGTWSRSSPNAPTTYTGADGKPLTFATGPVWVLLARG